MRLIPPEVLNWLHLNTSTFEKAKANTHGICALHNAQGDRSGKQAAVVIHTPSPSLNGNWPDRYLCSYCATLTAKVNPAIAAVITEEEVAPIQRKTNARPIRRLDTGEIYPSVHAAAEALSICHQTLRTAIARGTPSRGTRWEYVTEAIITPEQTEQAVLNCIKFANGALTVKDLLDLLDYRYSEYQIRVACNSLCDRGEVDSYKIARTRMFRVAQEKEVAHAS